MKYETLLVTHSEAVATVTLNRPERLNALNRQLVDELRDVATSLSAATTVRAVILTGQGRAFSSGADLMSDDLLQAPNKSLGAAVGASLREHMNPMISAWCDVPLPVVVAVNGVAAGAGMSLALVGDIVIAAKSASFAQLFAPKVGLMPDLGSTFFLPQLLGTARAKAMALLGEQVDAHTAAAWGLVWQCVEDAELSATVHALAQRLSGGPTEAFKKIKQIFNAPPAADLAAQLALEAVAQAELADTHDFAEGVRAFREKRAPQFFGR